jgi:hypothetical protein
LQLFFAFPFLFVSVVEVDAPNKYRLSREALRIGSEARKINQ